MVVILKIHDIEIETFIRDAIHAGADNITIDMPLATGGRFAGGALTISSITAGVLTDYSAQLINGNGAVLVYGDPIAVNTMRFISRKTSAGAGTVSWHVTVYIKK